MSKLIGRAEQDVWALEIGRLLVAFGSIESVARQCIGRLCTPVVADHTSRMQLVQRLRFAIDLVGQLDEDPATIASFQKAARKAVELAEDRNLVAHNPLCLVVFEDDQGMRVKKAIAREGKRKHIDLAELRKKVAAAQACEDALGTAFYALMDQIAGKKRRRDTVKPA